MLQRILKFGSAAGVLAALLLMSTPAMAQRHGGGGRGGYSGGHSGGYSGGHSYGHSYYGGRGYGPSVYFGLGSYGGYYPGAYSGYGYSSNYYNPPTYYSDVSPIAPIGYSTLSTPATPAEAPVWVTVRVPPGAELWFDDAKLRQTGESTRVFQSPPLTPGENYRYEVKARWMDNGKEVVRNRSIAVHAGEQVNLDLMAP